MQPSNNGPARSDSDAALDRLPVELITTIISLVDLATLTSVSQVSRRLRQVASDPVLNPWRAPIQRALQSDRPYPAELLHLSLRACVPRKNWLDVLVLANPQFILCEATLPNLSNGEWEECFRQRFLPSWVKVKKDGRWKKAYMETMWRIQHRLTTSCTTNEAWRQYLVVYRGGVGNNVFNLSRTYNPATAYQNIKSLKNLAHLKTHVRVLVQFSDVRLLLFGVRGHRRSLFVNPHASMLLHPPGVHFVKKHFSAEHEQSASVPAHSRGSESQQTIVPPTPITPIAPGPSNLSSPPPSPPPAHTALNASHAASGSGLSSLARSISHPAGSAGNTSLRMFRTLSRHTEASTHSAPSGSSSGAGFGGILRRFGLSNGASVPARGRVPPAISAPISNPVPLSLPTPTPAHVPQSTSALVPSTSTASTTGPSTSASATSRRPRANKALLNHAPKSMCMYPTLRHPAPNAIHANYPDYTPGGYDWRQWMDTDDGEDDGLAWVGPIMITAQLIGSSAPLPSSARDFEDDILTRGQELTWASVGWDDLWVVAPWLREHIRVAASHQEGDAGV